MKARRSTGPCALNVRCYKYFGWSRLVSALSLPFQLLISIDSNVVESCRNSGMHRDGIPDLLHDDTLDVLNNLPRVIRGEHTNQRAIMIPLFAATCEITELRSPLKTVQMFQNTSAERHPSGPQTMATQLQRANRSSLTIRSRLTSGSPLHICPFWDRKVKFALPGPPAYPAPHHRTISASVLPLFPSSLS